VVGVIAIKNEPKCKLCRHPQREEIDALLELRSALTRDPETKQLIYTLPVVLKQLAEWGVENPTEDNIKAHWRKHCEVVAEGVAVGHDAALEELRVEMLTILDASDGSIESDLTALRKLAMARIRLRVMKGEDPGVTVDQLLKSVAEMTKRAHNEATHELLTSLAGGMTRALAERRTPRAIEGAEVVDAEAVEVS
jgi:hypothetical protein